MFKKSKSGLTLIEILIVIVIIIILIFIFIAYFRSQIFRGNDAKRKGDIDRIKIAVEEYEKDHNCYPPPQLVTCNPGTGLDPYIGKIPCDPVTNASYFYDYDTSSVCAKWFRIYTNISPTDSAALTTCGPAGSYNYYSASPNAPDCNLTLNGGTFYGCKSGICVPIYWDAARPGPQCDPNFQRADCYGQCSAQTECKPWR